MKKYVLGGRSTPTHFNTEDPDSMVKKLALLESQGIDVGLYTVTEIDTEKYPPVTRSARDFIAAVWRGKP